MCLTCMNCQGYGALEPALRIIYFRFCMFKICLPCENVSVVTSFFLRETRVFFSKYDVTNRNTVHDCIINIPIRKGR